MPYLILVSIVWGFSFVIIKGTLVSLDASFVSLARLLLSLLVFLPFLRFAGLSLYEKLQLLLIGGIQFGLMYIAYVAAFQYLPAHVIALMTTTTPLFVAVFNDILAGKIHKRFFFAALLAVAGGAIIELPISLSRPVCAALFSFSCPMRPSPSGSLLIKNGWRPDRISATPGSSAFCTPGQFLSPALFRWLSRIMGA
jgi:drug/metabolite transporter (DMT)-like permease